MAFLCIIAIMSTLILDVSNGGKTILPGLGTLKGKSVATNMGKRVHAYLGVPYGNFSGRRMRFGPAEMVAPWKGVLRATSLAKSCWGSTDKSSETFEGSNMWNSPTQFTEDCLNMNIWVPMPESGVNFSTRFPVLVWIFGGGFFSGSPSLDLYDGSVLASENGVIVVNINYRLGPFGFLYFGDDSSAPGNVGLLDQQLALKWIQKYIEYFNGDPSSVTIFGESSGGASVSAHLIAPGSRRLFSRAILQSGVITNPWAIASPKDMLRRSKDFAQFPFVPISKDKNFFSNQDVFASLKAGTFKKCPVLLGTNTDEGTFWLPYYLGTYFSFSDAASDFPSENPLNRSEYLACVNETFRGYYVSSLLQKSIAEIVYGPKISALGNSSSSGLAYRDAVSDFVDDFFFTCDVLDVTHAMVNHGRDVYLYYFNQRSSANPWPKWMGVMHGYEIEYVFGYPLMKPGKYDPTTLETEQEFSKKMMKLWTNFAKWRYGFYGWILNQKLQKMANSFFRKPSLENFIWEKFDGKNLSLVQVLTAEGGREDVSPSWDRCEFWWDIGKTVRKRQSMEYYSYSGSFSMTYVSHASYCDENAQMTTLKCACSLIDVDFTNIFPNVLFREPLLCRKYSYFKLCAKNVPPLCKKTMLGHIYRILDDVCNPNYPSPCQFKTSINHIGSQMNLICESGVCFVIDGGSSEVMPEICPSGKLLIRTKINTNLIGASEPIEVGENGPSFLVCRNGKLSLISEDGIKSEDQQGEITEVHCV